MTQTPKPTTHVPVALDPDRAEALARAHGLRALGERPPLRSYVRDIVRRRSFLFSLASGQASAQFQNNRLGQLWALFNPALLILAYFLIFGLLLKTRDGVTNYVGFLSIGIIIFVFTSSILTSGAKAITGNLGLVRALRFPRAILPISVVLTEFIVAVPAFALLVALMLFTGETPMWTWLLFPISLAMTALSLIGIALLLARLVNFSRDLANFIPVSVRLLRYTSGVFFSVTAYASAIPVPGVAAVLEYQPVALFMMTAREALMHEAPLVASHWIALAGWSVVLSVGGLIIFWRDEAKYGRG